MPVVSATDGQAVLLLAESEQPEIVILDAVMAPISGFDVLESCARFLRIR
jgi:DNA-binding response OmpR family regulator